MTIRIWITRAESAVTYPDMVLGYQADRTPRTIVHELIGGVTDVTLIPAQLRSGTLGLFYRTQSAAQSALTLLSRPEVFSLFDDEPNPVLSIPFFVVTGGLRIELDPTTRRRWVLSVTYQELANG